MGQPIRAPQRRTPGPRAVRPPLPYPGASEVCCNLPAVIHFNVGVILGTSEKQRTKNRARSVALLFGALQTQPRAPSTGPAFAEVVFGGKQEQNTRRHLHKHLPLKPPWFLKKIPFTRLPVLF